MTRLTDYLKKSLPLPFTFELLRTFTKRTSKKNKNNIILIPKNGRVKIIIRVGLALALVTYPPPSRHHPISLVPPVEHHCHPLKSRFSTRACGRRAPYPLPAAPGSPAGPRPLRNISHSLPVFEQTSTVPRNGLFDTHEC